VALEQFELTGQVAIVTGAGRGVGEGTAKVLAEAGATVVGTARTSSEVESTIEDIKATGGNGIALTADALVRKDSERVVQTTVDELGRFDILVNNVGFATFGPFLNLTDENLRDTFDYCVTSAFIMSQLVVPHMLAVGNGSIVNISSGAGRFGIRGLLPYCVAKGGLEALTRAMAQELAPKIRVNAIALGGIHDNRPAIEFRPASGVGGEVERAHSAAPHRRCRRPRPADPVFVDARLLRHQLGVRRRRGPAGTQLRTAHPRSVRGCDEEQ